MTATVTALAITPVKGLALLHPASIELGPHGVAENRRFYLLAADGRHRSGLAFGPLSRIVPAYDPVAETLELAFPDGRLVKGRSDDLREPAEVPWGSGTICGHRLGGPFGPELSAYVGQELRLVRAEPGQEPQSHHVSMLSEASLAVLARSVDASNGIDDRRFRMLVRLTGTRPFEEDTWSGSVVRIGQAVVRVEGPVARCATTTRDPSTGIRDFDALRAIRNLRGLSARNTIDFGVYADVLEPGRVALGDEVVPV